MSSTIIDLAPTMQIRLNFEHPLFDNVDDYKIEVDDLPLERFIEFRDPADRDTIILAMMWLAKDVVSRYRGHFPSIRHLTDDLCGESLLYLTEFVENLELDDMDDFFNKVQNHIRWRLRDYINDNRSTFSASRAQNERIEEEGGEPEYNFAVEYCDEFNSKTCEDFEAIDYLDEIITFVRMFRSNEIPMDEAKVDFMDAIDRIAEVDHEELRELVLGYLSSEHDIQEEELTPSQASLLEAVATIGRKL